MTPGGARVLVVEDETPVRELLRLHLSRAGFSSTEAGTAGQAWQLLSQVDIVVLDRLLPDESGDRFLQRLRGSRLSHLPVLMLTAKATESDRVEGLEAGADDYLTKPFSAAELIARLRALLRRVPRRSVVQIGDLTLDLSESRLSRNGEEVELTRREFELLAFLITNPGRIFGRRELLDKVWGEDFLGTERTVDQHVAQLRNRLGDWVVETLRGRGYRLGERGDARA